MLFETFKINVEQFPEFKVIAFYKHDKRWRLLKLIASVLCLHAGSEINSFSSNV